MVKLIRTVAAKAILAGLLAVAVFFLFCSAVLAASFLGASASWSCVAGEAVVFGSLVLATETLNHLDGE